MQELEIVREKIQSKYRVVKTDEDLGWNRAIDLCTNIINAHIKYMNDGWVPVEKELPEEGQEVWVSSKTDCVRRGTYTKHFGAEHKEGFVCSDGIMWMNTANAWQPYYVPEPYCPERSEKK